MLNKSTRGVWAGAIGFEEFLQVVFEAGRKSVKEAEERERRRQEKIAMDPLQARRELAKKAAMAAKASAQQQLQAASVRPDLMTVATCSRSVGGDRAGVTAAERWVLACLTAVVVLLFRFVCMCDCAAGRRSLT